MSNTSNALDKHLQNAFADFEGLHISGTIPLRQEILNELLADVLQNGLPTPPAPTAQAPQAAAPLDAALSAPPTPRAKVDVNALLKRVKRAQVRFENGRAVVDFEIGV